MTTEIQNLYSEFVNGVQSGRHRIPAEKAAKLLAELATTSVSVVLMVNVFGAAHEITLDTAAIEEIADSLKHGQGYVNVTGVYGNSGLSMVKIEV